MVQMTFQGIFSASAMRVRPIGGTDEAEGMADGREIIGILQEHGEA
jgi:hypothetical protein